MFRNYKDCLFNNTVILRSKSDNHEMYTDKVNKVELSSNDDKRLQTLDRGTAYPPKTNEFKVSESELIKKYAKLKQHWKCF